MAIDVWADTVQTAAVCIGAGALAYAAMQVRMARHGGGGANVLQLWSFLQSDAARAHRGALYRAHEKNGPFDESAMNWDDDELEAARHVAQVWSVTGRLVKSDLVPKNLVLEEWGHTVLRNWNIAEPAVRRERTRSGNHNLFGSFDWLARSAAEHAERPTR